jgi:hypothetical protein
VKTRVLVEVLSVKTIPPCGGNLFYRHSRVVGSTISLFLDFQIYQFYFSSVCVFCELFKCNVIAFTLHLRGGGGVKGRIVKVIIVIL